MFEGFIVDSFLMLWPLACCASVRVGAQVKRE